MGLINGMNQVSRQDLDGSEQRIPRHGKMLGLINQLLPRGCDLDVRGDYGDEDIEHSEEFKEEESKDSLKKRTRGRVD
jgi:hypothetical protein